MTTEHKRHLEKYGFYEMDIQEFLGLSDQEMAMIDLEISLNKQINQRIDAEGAAPAVFAKRARVLTKDVRRVLKHSPSIPLETLFKLYFSLGGKIHELNMPKRKPKPKLTASR